MSERLATREIYTNLTATVDTVTAWYVLPPKTWSFTSEATRTDMVWSIARRLAALAGTRNIHLRVTSRPYPVPLWAERLDAITKQTANGPLPGCDGDTWADYLKGVQAHLYRQTLDDKEVYLGIPVHHRTLANRIGEKVGERGLRQGEINPAAKRAAEVTDIVGGPGLDGRPATAHEIEWLIHRSVGLLMPAPLYVSPVDDPRWEPDDMDGFTDSIDYQTRPLGKTVKVLDTRGMGDPVERHVTVLTMGRMGDIEIPGADYPWMQRTDWCPFPVEWSARFDVLTGTQASAEMKRQLRLLRDQIEHTEEHGIDVPLDLERKADEAQRKADEMDDGDVIASTRVHGRWRIAVAGRTERECLERARQVRDLYQQIQMTVLQPKGQYPLLREFIPGEPLGHTAHLRHLPVLYAAAAVPQITATVGDRVGDNIGHTAGTSRRPVMFDPHYNPEVREASGCVPIIGEQGAGKSIALGWIAYQEARRGVVTTVLDPGGPLAGLTRLPELAAHSQHLDLLHGAPGSLNPATVVADPTRDAYPVEDEYRNKVAESVGTRKQLLTDIAMQLLPPDVRTMPRTRSVLGKAVRATSGQRTSSLNDVLTNLDALKDEHATDVADNLRDLREMPQARLFFPPDENVDAPDADSTLLVLTMEGLTLPIDTDQTHWTIAERMAIPLLHLATYASTRRIYGLPRQQRKCIGLDEMKQMHLWSSGQALVTGLAAGSRKLNACVLVSSQDPADVLNLNVANLIGGALVGRITDTDIAAQALRLLQVPTDVGYEQVLHGLSPHREGRRAEREFVFRDVVGNREKIKIDVHRPHVLAAIDSTPTSAYTLPTDLTARPLVGQSA